MGIPSSTGSVGRSLHLGPVNSVLSCKAHPVDGKSYVSEKTFEIYRAYMNKYGVRF